MSIFGCFRRNERGNVATIFALALVPLFGIVGAAIDFGHVSEVRAKLADALDAGVLAVGTQPNMSDEEAYKIVSDWVTAHLGEPYAKYWHLDSVASARTDRSTPKPRARSTRPWRESLATIAWTST